MARKKTGNSWGGLAQVGGAKRPKNSWGGLGSVGGTAPPIGSSQQPVYNTGTGGAWSSTPPPVGGRPLDWQEEAYKLSANRQMALGNLDATYQRGVTDQEYGYGATGAANPYSRAALLEESFKRAKRGTTTSMASAGQLYSGAYGRAQGENDHQYSIASDRNRRDYDQSVYGINRGQAQNAAAYGLGVDDEAFAALLRALGGK